MRPSGDDKHKTEIGLSLLFASVHVLAYDIEPLSPRSRHSSCSHKDRISSLLAFFESFVAPSTK